MCDGLCERRGRNSCGREYRVDAQRGEDERLAVGVIEGTGSNDRSGRVGSACFDEDPAAVRGKLVVEVGHRARIEVVDERVPSAGRGLRRAEDTVLENAYRAALGSAEGFEIASLGACRRPDGCVLDLVRRLREPDDLACVVDSRALLAAPPSVPRSTMEPACQRTA